MPRIPVPPPSKLNVVFKKTIYLILEKKFFSFAGTKTSREVKEYKQSEQIKIVGVIDNDDYWDIIIQDPARQGLMDGGTMHKILNVPKSVVNVFEYETVATSVPPPRKR
jgi:hypothetical protein